MQPELSVGQSALLTDLAMCLNHWRLSSPGFYCCVLVPVQLNPDTRLHPGVMAMVNHGKHKQCSVDPDGAAFIGPPNFVLDVFCGGGLEDYEHRRACYERAGVIEYVAVEDAPSPVWRWNRQVEGRFALIEEDDPGVIRSAALPGLWIPTEALRNRNWWQIMASISQGITRVGHHEMMESIWKK